MALRRGWILAPILAVTTSCAGDLPLVGVNSEGRLIETTLKERQYVTYLQDSLTDMSDSVIPVMDGQEARYMAGLREVEVGLHVKGSAGLGSWWRVGGFVGLELVFSN